MSQPIRPVSARKYPGNGVKGTASFPVKLRLKGTADGPVYQGQSVVIPCKTCPTPAKSNLD